VDMWSDEVMDLRVQLEQIVKQPFFGLDTQTLAELSVEATDEPNTYVFDSRGAVQLIAAKLIQAESERDALRRAVEEALKRVPEEAKFKRTCIDYDPGAGSTYEVTEADWYLEALAALAPAAGEKGTE
jgi:hypothetical protein